VRQCLSRWLRLTIRREGRKHFVEFHRGVVVDRLTEIQRGVEVSPLRVVGSTEKRGTELHFMADEEIFGQVEFHYEIIAKRLRELSFLNNGVKIRLHDQRSGKDENFAFLGGVKGFVEYINRTKSVLHPNIFYASGDSLAAMARSASKSPCNGTTVTPSRSSVSPTTSPRPMAAPT
jgi:DNA gyrase subunit B